MDSLSQLEDLKAVASKISIEIECRNLKDEEFRFQSGLCKVNGKDLIILDNYLSKSEQIAIVIKTLKNFNLDNLFVAPWIRERLEESVQ